MQLRAPAVPLLTFDPYYSIWSMNDTLPGNNTKHWTGKPHRLIGRVRINEVSYCFMGEDKSSIELEQVSIRIQAMTTDYTFKGPGFYVEVTFFSPLLLDELDVLSRPIGYIEVNLLDDKKQALDGMVELEVCDELALNFRYEQRTESNPIETGELTGYKIGNVIQKPCNRVGDDLRINWGHLYILGEKGAKTSLVTEVNDYGMESTNGIVTTRSDQALFLLGYDDQVSLIYFEQPLEGYWKKDKKDILWHLDQAYNDYDRLRQKCQQFSDTLYVDAERVGGVHYGELLLLAYRQVIAGHKCVSGPNGEFLFISKENYSNGCAATVDVSYPSIPLFLLYNTECIKGMMRPIFDYARRKEWFYNFAPHDVGCYPVLNGQVYSEGTAPDWQMPIEECGNMLIMAAAVAKEDKEISFYESHMDVLKTWANYLVDYGMDPSNQLCTDDFAGHLAHNCNLALKAIMGIASFGLLCRWHGRVEESKYYLSLGKKMAQDWIKHGIKEDGTFKLAFDVPDSYSMKYNGVWDMLLETNLFETTVFEKETELHVQNHQDAYGLVLDNREHYTKTDWLVWTAMMSRSKEVFKTLIEPMYQAYHISESRVPLTDWYDTLTAKQMNFQNRTVQGGLFMGIYGAQYLS